MSYRLEVLSDDPPPLCEIERVAIRHRLALMNWQLSKVAKSLSIDRLTLRNKIRKYNINQGEVK